jgi:WD40 repeat protein
MCEPLIRAQGRKGATGLLLLIMTAVATSAGTDVRAQNPARLRGHTSTVNALAFSPAAKTLASGGDDQTVRLWDMAERKLRLTLKGHTGGVTAVAFSPDGRLVASGSVDKTIKLWDAPSGKPVATLRGHTEVVYCVAFAPDGQTLASGSFDQTVRLWQVSTGKELAVLKGHTDTVSSVAFSVDGKTLASGGEDLTLRLWDVTGRKEKSLIKSEGRIAWSADRKMWAVADGDVKLWDSATGRPSATLKRPDGPRVFALTFAGDGKTLAVSAGGPQFGSVRVWDVTTQKERDTYDTGPAFDVALTPDGQALAVASKSGDVLLYALPPAPRAATASSTPQPPLANPSNPPQPAAQPSSQAPPPALLPEEPPPGQPVRPDHALLEMDLPPGATVSINGIDRGAQRRFAFGPFPPGFLGTWRLQAQFPDGKKIPAATPAVVYLKAGWHLRVPLPAPGVPRPEVVVQTGYSSFVDGVAVSPDGRQVLTNSWKERSAFLWDTATGQQLRVLQGHTDTVTALAFSSDGKQVLTGSSDRKALRWDAATGRILNTLNHDRPTDGSVTFVAFTPDGKSWWTGSFRDLCQWDAATGKFVRSFRCSHPITAAALSPDGKQVVTASWSDRTAVLWDLAGGKEVRAFQGHTEGIYAVAFSPDGKQIVTGSDDKTAVVWDVASGKPVQVFAGLGHPVKRVAVSPDGKQVLLASFDLNKAVLWDVASGKPVREFPGHSAGITAVAYTPEGKQVLTCSYDKTAVLWEAATGQKQRVLQGQASPLNMVGFNHDGKRVYLGGAYGTALVLDATTGQKLRHIQLRSNRLNSLAVSPDGRYLVIGSNDTSVLLFDVAAGQAVRSFQGHTAGIHLVAFSPTGRHLVTGSQDKTAILWDVSSGQALHTLKGHTAALTAVTFSPDGSQVLTGSQDQTARLWEVAGGKPLAVFEGHRNAINGVAFRGDGRGVLTCSVDGTALLWDAQQAVQVRVFQGHSGAVTAVACSPDGQQVVTTGVDGLAILWHVSSGRRLRTYQGHAGSVNSVAFSPDGKQILTGSSDGTARLWDFATGDELLQLICLNLGQDWMVVNPYGFFDGSADGRQKVAYRMAGLNVVSVDRFFQDFYRPGLLASTRLGERPMPAVEFAKNRAPTLRLVSPQPGGPVEQEQVTLDVEAVDEGGGVQGPWLVHNGARVLVTTKAERQGQTVRRRFPVSLVAGENRLEVRAASSDGSMESEPAALVLRYEKPLPKPELYLLAVGINRYAQDSINLRFAAADAQAVVQLFERRGQKLYQKVHAHALLDDKATKEGIRQALAEVARRAKPQDTLVVFLAGHGTMVGQRYYFVPHEFRPGAGTPLEEVIGQQGLAGDVLADYLGEVPALKRVLIFDTCQSGGAVAVKRTARNPFAFRGAIERLSRAQGVFTLAATAASEEAQEPKELGHGVLTYALLAGLRAVAAGPLKDQGLPPGQPERVVDVLEWFGFASDQVPRLTRQIYGREQDVQMSTQGNNFKVLPLRA